MKLKKGDSVILTKITDDKFNGEHPNGIIAGYTRSGILQHDIEVGMAVLVIGPARYLCTSDVTEIIDDNTFKTRNSTYNIDLYEDNSIIGI